MVSTKRRTDGDVTFWIRPISPVISILGLKLAAAVTPNVPLSSSSVTANPPVPPTGSCSAARLADCQGPLATLPTRLHTLD